MDRFEHLKVFQIIFYITFSLFSGYMLLQPSVKHYVFSSRPATCLFVCIWLLLLCNIIFLILDYYFLSRIKSGSNTLYGAVYSDQIANIPNRFSCDTIIEKYLNQSLPQRLTCIMFDLTNLTAINDAFGHTYGNNTIKDFSAILTKTAASYGFVGRNGGNKFLAVFENCSSSMLSRFLKDLEQEVQKHNQTPLSITIEYSYGYAENKVEKADSIIRLITIANERIAKNI